MLKKILEQPREVNVRYKINCLVTNLDMHQSHLGELCKNRDSQATPLEVDLLCSPPHPQTEALHLQSEIRLNLHISPEKQQSNISNPYLSVNGQ